MTFTQLANKVTNDPLKIRLEGQSFDPKKNGMAEHLKQVSFSF